MRVQRSQQIRTAYQAYWEAVGMPPSLARVQSRWELRQSVLRALTAGATRKEIAAKLQITPSQLAYLEYGGMGGNQTCPDEAPFLVWSKVPKA